jgi:hypothetical protein
MKIKENGKEIHALIEDEGGKVKAEAEETVEGGEGEKTVQYEAEFWTTGPGWVVAQ